MLVAAGNSRSLVYACGTASEEWAMARYFFDLIGHSRSIFDFHGGTFSDRYEAHEQAQLLALNLQVEEDEAFVGGRVHVRDAQGGVMFSVEIHEPEQLAA